MLSAYLIASLVLGASAKLSPQKHKDDISSAEHYKDGVHDAKYDHDAFLGEQMAHEWEKLPPSEVKKRLRYVVNSFIRLSATRKLPALQRKQYVSSAEM